MARPFIGDIYPGSVHETTNGKVKVLEVKNPSQVVIRFLETKTVVTAASGNIRKGLVKDPYRPSLYGVGFMGQGNYNGKDHYHLYVKWKDMLDRCYSPKCVSYHNYGGKGVTVEPVWHNFQNFAEWLETRMLDMGLECLDGYQLDKDGKIPNNLTYGPEQCMLLTQKENLLLATFNKGKKHNFVNKDGTKEFLSVGELARKYDISRDPLDNVVRGITIETRSGWSLQNTTN